MPRPCDGASLTLFGELIKVLRADVMMLAHHHAAKAG
jgi:hypothetical protein